MIRNFFLKRLRSYFLIMIIPTLLLFLLIGYFFLSAQQKAIEKRGTDTLNSFEQSIEASLYNMGYQLDLMMSNSAFSLSLKNLLDNQAMDQKDQIVFSTLKTFFGSYSTAYSYINSIYLYLDGKDRFVTSVSGQIANTDTYFDRQWLEEYQNMNPQAKVFTSKRWIQQYTYGEPTELITVYYRNTYLRGGIIINVDKSEYGKLLRNVMVSDKQKIFLLNSSGDIICTTDPSFEDLGFEALALKEFEVYKDNLEAVNDRWMKIGGSYYYLHMQHSEYLDLIQVSAISLDYVISEIQYYLILFVLIFFLEMLIILLLAYSYTKRSFYYINQCVDIFSAAERGGEIRPAVDDVKDEYGMILNNIIFLYLKNNQMQVELMEKQHQNQVTEMLALQLQINPHFFFNTLQIMDIEVVRNLGVESTLHHIIQQLSRVVKYAFTDPTKVVTVKEELDYLKAYLEIQKVRFGHEYITYFEIDDGILEEEVFRLLLQPLLENCFKHGLGGGKKIVIKIKIYDNNEQIYFAVVDNGIGMDSGTLSRLFRTINDWESQNIGLTNVNRRLILHYGEDSRLVIRSKKNWGTVISFVIPKSPRHEITKSTNRN